MRTKQEILEQSQRVMLRAGKEGQLMVEHGHLFLEVWIDIRDILEKLEERPGYFQNIISNKD